MPLAQESTRPSLGLGSPTLRRLSFPAVLTLGFVALAWLLLRYEGTPTEETKSLAMYLILFALVVPMLWIVGYRMARWPRHAGLCFGALVVGVAAALLWPELTPAFVPLMAAGLVVNLVSDWLTQRDDSDQAPWSCVVCDHVNEAGMPVCVECSAPARTD